MWLTVASWHDMLLVDLLFSPALFSDLTMLLMLPLLLLVLLLLLMQAGTKGGAAADRKGSCVLLLRLHKGGPGAAAASKAAEDMTGGLGPTVLRCMFLRCRSKKNSKDSSSEAVKKRINLSSGSLAK